MAFDVGNAATGALTGGGVGAAFGPNGAAAGAGVGGLLGGLGGGKSKKDKIKQLAKYDPQQEAFLNQLLEMAQQGNKNAFDYLNSILSDEEGAFEDFERPYLQQFNEEVIPSILERFTGSSMSKGGSALNQSLGRAATNLSTNLASQRANLKNNAINQLNQYGQMALTQKSQPYVQKGKTGAFEMLGDAASSGYADLGKQYQQSGGWQDFLGLGGQAT